MKFLNNEKPEIGGGHDGETKNCFVDDRFHGDFSPACARRSAATVRKRQGAVHGEENSDRYLSRTNNTRAIADTIHEELGGKLIALELQTPYPSNYQATVQQVVRENESWYLPPLRTVIYGPVQYHFIFVGFPTWDMKLPPPMKSFLLQHSLAGKTIVPFNSNGGYGSGSTFQTVRDLCPHSNVVQGFSTRGGSERDGHLLAIKDARTEEVRKEVEIWLWTVGMHK